MTIDCAVFQKYGLIEGSPSHGLNLALLSPSLLKLGVADDRRWSCQLFWPCFHSVIIPHTAIKVKARQSPNLPERVGRHDEGSKAGSAAKIWGDLWIDGMRCGEAETAA